MSNVRYLELDPNMAAKAKAADDAAKHEFYQKVVGFSDTFSVKETSRLLAVSVGWLRTYAVNHGITFPDPTLRTAAEQRAVNRKFDKERPLSRAPRRIQRTAPTRIPSQAKLTPEQEVLSQRALRRAKAAFHMRVLQLSELFTLREAANILNVSVRFLKNFGYEWDIEFCGEQRAYSVNIVEEVTPSVARTKNPFVAAVIDAPVAEICVSQLQARVPAVGSSYSLF
jgi:phage antirepressor YoqD-like protein